MVSSFPSTHLTDDATIFDVFAARARSRGVRYLTVQAGVAFALAAAIFAAAPALRSLAIGAIAVGAYSAWGIVDACEPLHETFVFDAAKRTLAAIAFVASIAAVIGTAYDVFSGTAHGPYNVCTAFDGRSFRCDSMGRQR
jgi:hypothetical protein